MGHNEPTRGISAGAGRSRAEVSAAGSREIPDKLYFRIGDVAQICDVPTYVLRFWETEFPQLKPNKGGTGQRLYRRRDVEMALRIKRLLYNEGYTIPGARQLLKSEQRETAPQLSLLGPVVGNAHMMAGVRRELEAIVAQLSQPVGAGASRQSPRRVRRAASLPSAGVGSPLHSVTAEIPFDEPPEGDDSSESS